MQSTHPPRRRILILGGGFGGAYCALELQKLLRRRPELCDHVEIVLFDRNNYFVFSPLLVEAGTGSVQPSHAVVALRDFCPDARFIMAEVRDIDLARRRVTYQLRNESEPRRMNYDQVVVALGTVTLKPPVPGLARYGYELKTLGDALALRDRVVQLFEQADQVDDPDKRRELLTLTVVGGSFTGVETAGEFHHYMHAAARAYPNLREEDVKVVILNRGDRLLPQIDQSLGEWTLRHLRRRGIEVRLNTEATGIGENYVELAGGERLRARTVVWAAGIQPNPSVKFFDVPIDRRGYILCQRDLRIVGYDNAWGLGDAAVNPTAKGDPYPATAQAAVGQAKICARNIVRVLAGEPTEPCDFLEKGMLAAFGKGDAVGEVMGAKVTGWVAWWMWRTVYLGKMPGFGRKVRVAADWTLDLFTRRQFVEMGIHRVVKEDASDEAPEADDVPATDRQRVEPSADADLQSRRAVARAPRQ